MHLLPTRPRLLRTHAPVSPLQDQPINGVNTLMIQSPLCHAIRWGPSPSTQNLYGKQKMSSSSQHRHRTSSKRPLSRSPTVSMHPDSVRMEGPSGRETRNSTRPGCLSTHFTGEEAEGQKGEPLKTARTAWDFLWWI